MAPAAAVGASNTPMDLVKSLNQSDFLTPMPPSPGDAGTFDC
jgi:hypothetical protein